MNDDYEEFTLENGLKVGLKRTPTETIYGCLRVFHGAVHEKPGEEGLAHFLEHSLMSGGTQKYSPDEVECLLTQLHDHNAGTTLDHTVFYADMLPEGLETFLDLYS